MSDQNLCDVIIATIAPLIREKDAQDLRDKLERTRKQVEAANFNHALSSNLVRAAIYALRVIANRDPPYSVEDVRRVAAICASALDRGDVQAMKAALGPLKSSEKVRREQERRAAIKARKDDLQERREAAYSMRQDGKTLREIGRYFQRSPSMIKWWIARVAAERDTRLKNPLYGLSVRAQNCLRGHYGRYASRYDFSKATDDELLNIPNFGKECLIEVRGWLNGVAEPKAVSAQENGLSPAA
jgi:hypothetical protein